MTGVLLEYSDATRWKAWLTSAQPRFAGCAAGNRVTGPRVDSISMSAVASPLRTPVVAWACRWRVWARKSSRSLMAASLELRLFLCRWSVCRLRTVAAEGGYETVENFPHVSAKRIRQARRRSTGAAGTATRDLWLWRALARLMQSASAGLR